MSKSSSARIAKDENRRRLKQLMERYGNLLTPKQAKMVKAYAVDGLSFSEVARQCQVSRQAVHESVRSAERVLTEYDDKLKHLSTQQLQQQGLLPQQDITEVVSKLESLKVKIARTGIIYSVDWIRREIDTVMGMLNTGTQAAEADTEKNGEEHRRSDSESNQRKLAESTKR